MKGKRILLGVTGGIAAYKSADLVRRLIEHGAEVQVVMTAAARKFVTPMTFQALSGRAVRSNLWDPAAEAAMGHIELARWAQLLLIAPASADFLARLAHGLADDLLSTLALASAAPIAVAPAMNQLMWQHPTTQRNIVQLQADGVQILRPDSGDQACGDQGPGRMQEPEHLLQTLSQLFHHNPDLNGKKVVITAGPTQEAIDPVRFISNYSSGKMGYALAHAAKRRGAEVVLISGPTHLSVPDGVQCVAVTTAQEMHTAVMAHMSHCDIFIANAAVADYRSEQIHFAKMQKQEHFNLSLIRNPDILANVAALSKRPFVVGFAAETDHVIENARNKLKRKNIDLIFANQVGVEHSGFHSDDNAVTLISKQTHLELPRMPKTELAEKIWDCIVMAVNSAK